MSPSDITDDYDGDPSTPPQTPSPVASSTSALTPSSPKTPLKLADQFEGEVSTERAMLDIKRGMRDNLHHECVGY